MNLSFQEHSGLLLCSFLLFLEFFLVEEAQSYLMNITLFRSVLIVNQERCKFYDWLTANRLILNVKKKKSVLFSPAQRKFTYQAKIMIFDNEQNKNVALECKEFIKYLEILADNN